MKYVVTRSNTEAIEVEGRNPSDALNTAMGYDNEYNWKESSSYTVTEVTS